MTKLCLLAGAVLALTLPQALAQLSDVGESHITGNVPAPEHFRFFLLRDLTAELEPRYGSGITVDYELLREGATQTGVASPKFYLWVKLTRAEKHVAAGAARVAAVEKKQFEVLQFISATEIIAQPDAVARSFPPALVPIIREKARPR